MSEELTRIDDFTDFYAKREDSFCLDKRSANGAKVRQYLAMIAQSNPRAALAVGCGRFSAMQIYVAELAHELQRDAYIVVPHAATRSDATNYCINAGARVIEVSPGYPSYCRASLRKFAEQNEIEIVKWNTQHACDDTAAQVANLPESIKRVIVPTGSALTAAGVAIGLARAHRKIMTLCVSVSQMVRTKDQVLKLCKKYAPTVEIDEDRIKVVNHRMNYRHALRDVRLPDGTLLDPYYAAKAYGACCKGDCLWVVGRRPLALC
jgi:1-aminocyclopropane-1-carboxylate deaminase/D-cysteine desulfhydrase-like pyridoxal-dependent ACC family enzyme